MKTQQAPIDSKFGFNSTADEVAEGLDLTGKIFVITGGHSGIGLETTRVLSNHGAKVIVGARDLEKAHRSLLKFANVECFPLDLSVPSSVDSFVQKVLSNNSKIDVLINNAGVMATPETRDSRGYEIQFATNHLGHFQLTKRLLSTLEKNGGARVVTLTSAGHRFSDIHFEDIHFENRPYDKWQAYGQSKTANSLFAVELDRRAQQFGVRSFAVHPGRIAETSLMRHMEKAEFIAAVSASPAMMKTVQQGAATTVWAATSAQLNEKGGVYCADCNIAALVDDISKYPAGVLKYAIDEAHAKKLWEISEQMILRS